MAITCETADSELIEHGPVAVLNEIQARGAELNLAVLALTCARLARQAQGPEDALAWGDAAILCYSMEAAQVPSGWVRQGRECGAHGVAALGIARFGRTAGHNERRLVELLAWVNDGMTPFGSAAEFRAALDSAHPLRTFALQLRERLQVARHVRHALPTQLADWFDAVAPPPE
jgi:hypothetical protein